MGAVIRLTVLTGPDKGKRICMRQLSACLVGRAEACQVRFDESQRTCHLSRRHCQLFFDPPLLRVQDLGSVNGTYLNGKKLGEPSNDSCALAQGDQPVGVAQDTDILTIGGMTIQVHVMDCPLTCRNESETNVIWKESDVVIESCPMACS
jgi:eukaryotic-like serine/threonine-protein kinase